MIKYEYRCFPDGIVDEEWEFVTVVMIKGMYPQFIFRRMWEQK